jgi:hypothetical protein
MEERGRRDTGTQEMEGGEEGDQVRSPTGEAGMRQRPVTTREIAR